MAKRILKLTRIHPRDAYFEDRGKLVGLLFVENYNPMGLHKSIISKGYLAGGLDRVYKNGRKAKGDSYFYFAAAKFQEVS